MKTELRSGYVHLSTEWSNIAKVWCKRGKTYALVNDSSKFAGIVVYWIKPQEDHPVWRIAPLKTIWHRYFKR